MPKLSLPENTRSTSVYVPIYGLYVYFYVNPNIQSAYDFACTQHKGLKEMETAKHEAGVTYVLDGVNIVLLQDFKDMGILVHELVHVASNIFEYICAEHNEETDEFYAYMVEFLYDESTRALKNVRN